MNRPAFSLVCLMFAGLTLAIARSATDQPQGAYDTVARFAQDGRLLAPTGYREWIFLSSGLDMSYRKDSGMNHSMFDNVFVDPGAYRAFVQTGRWPEGTMLVKEDRIASGKGSINQGGKFQTSRLIAIEVHTKDTKRFNGGWAFFVFDSGGTEPAVQIPTSADCYSCHGAHGAVDSTFVQFYPTLVSIAEQKHTVAPDIHP